MMHELYNTDTDQVERRQEMSLQEGLDLNAEFRQNKEPQRWLVVHRDEYDPEANHPTEDSYYLS
jgi:hypothetical protein